MQYFNQVRFDNIEYETVKARGRKITYLNLECGFDIETTSYTMADETKVAFIYEWTFGIKDKQHICYGRTWEEFLTLCNTLKQVFNLNEERVLVVYVHNFSFEFQFMRKYFNWLKVFAVDDRKPVKALCDFGIEFRDSYILSGYSLAKTAENLQFHKIEKLTGDLDYSLVRTPYTKLTETELSYCEHDVLIILYYINEQIRQYENINKIPMTNTGRVRRYVRNCCYKSDNRKENNRKAYKFHKTMMDLQITVEEYKMLKRAFQGGYTHANANYTNMILEDVSSIDFTSSYPSVMLSEKFPMSKGIKTSVREIKRMFPESKKPFEDFINKFCSVFDIEFIGFKSKVFQDNYLSESKCWEIEKPIINNGRVFSADRVVTTITNIDYKIMQRCYTWDKIGVKNIYRYNMGYLPKEIIKAILKLYSDKTTLKDVESMEVEYLLSKGMLNSVYGMSVTDIVRDEIIYTDDWGMEEADIEKQIETYNKSYNRFLYYPWGVWVTAYARKNLWLGILAIGNDYVYSDTDSIKCLNYPLHKDYVLWYNEQVTKKLHAMCDYWKIDKSLLCPKTIEGKEKPIGVWDFEGTYTRFKTLGAKRYLVELPDGKMKLTVAGLGKRDGMDYMKEVGHDNTGVFNFFNDEMYIPAERTGKNTHIYIDEEMELDVTDYEGKEAHIITKSGVHLEPCEFTLSISKQYKKFLEMLFRGYLYKGVDEVG